MLHDAIHTCHDLLTPALDEQQRRRELVFGEWRTWQSGWRGRRDRK